MNNFMNSVCLKNSFYASISIDAILLVVLILLLIILCVSLSRGRKKCCTKNSQSKTENDELGKLSREIENLKTEKNRAFENGALYSLTLLQREGRFVDFIKEDIKQFSDEQVGIAVRQIHSGCGKVLNDVFNIVPFFANKAEGENIKVDPNFDKDSISLLGNSKPNAENSGILRHKGWVSKKRDLPSVSNKSNFTVIQQAEVEVN